MNELMIPPFAYNPVASSLDSYGLFLKAPPKEACVLSNLYQNCPTVMFFETEMHPENTDIATFLGTELDRYSETLIVNKDIKIIRHFTGGTCETQEDNNNEADTDRDPHYSISTSHSNSHSNSPPGDPRRLSSRFAGFLKGADYWVPEGTGFNRLKEIGMEVAIPNRSNEYLFPAATSTIPHEDCKEMSSNTDNEMMIREAMTRNNSTTTAPASSLSQQHPPNNQNRKLSKNSSSSSTNSLMDLSNSSTGSNPPFGVETLDNKTKRLKQSSIFGHLPTWKLNGLIALSKNDLRQEAFIMQMISFFQKKLSEARIPVWLYNYHILSVHELRRFTRIYSQCDFH
jgi:hypothetical protein